MATNRHCWQPDKLKGILEKQFQKQRKQMSSRVGEASPWWNFVYQFPRERDAMIQQLIHGEYRFSPMKLYVFKDEAVQTWDYRDRLALHVLWQILLPVAKKILPSRSYHLQGGVRKCLRDIEKTVKAQNFNYVMRLDIKGYYASIDHEILFKQVKKYISDPLMLHYLEQIITIPVDRNANILLPTKGIPRRSSLSPFFGALYLLPLLNALQQRKGVESFLFMDDLLVLVKTKRQLRKAKKILFQQLDELKLKLSEKKSKISELKEFHFLGAHFQVSQNAENKKILRVQVHQRSCMRALDKVKAMTENTVNPVRVQSYLVGWAGYWSATLKPISYIASLKQWITNALACFELAAAWLGWGVLPRRMACVLTGIVQQCSEIGL